MRSKTVRYSFVASGILALAIAALLWYRQPDRFQERDLPVVAITQFASHPALDDVRRGIIDGLRLKGYVDNESVRILFRNANGDANLAASIAQDFAQRRASVIVPITTPSALACAKATRSIPIVFGGVTDPVKAGLVADLRAPGGNITGTSDRWPYEQQIQFFKELLPQIKTLGVLYRPGDDVSEASVAEITRLAPRYDLTVITLPVSQSADVYPSAVSLYRRVDAIYTGADNLIAENLEGVLKASAELRKPLLAADSGSIDRGALATVSVSMHDIGVKTADMIAQVLKGAQPATLPVQILTNGDRIVNRAAAAAVAISPEVLKTSGAQLR